MHTTTLSAAALFASALVLGGPTLSLAQSRQCLTQTDTVAIEGAVVRVSYADLDLARPDHARILDRRLNRAASRVCSTYLAVSHYRLRHLCIRAALCDARRQVALQYARGQNAPLAPPAKRFD